MSPQRLVLCAHGTRSAAGRAAIEALVAQVETRLGAGVEVQAAFVDVHGPTLAQTLRDDAVVVPVLLSPGYHTQVDIAEASEQFERVRVTPTLGPDEALVTLLAQRLSGLTGLPGSAGAGAAPDHVVLAAAGSSRDEAAEAVEQTARALSQRLDVPVTSAYGASREPTVPAAVALARAQGAQRVVIAAYLLARGFFHRSLLDAGADAVTGPLITPGEVDPGLVGLIVSRFARA